MIWILILGFPLFYWLFKFVKYERYLRKFPGPTPWPIIGNAYEFNTIKKIMDTLNKYRQKYKGNFRIYMGFDPVIVVTEAKSIEFFLSNTNANACLKKSKHYTFFRKWLKNGLLVSNGSYWQKRRKLITPAFHFNILKEQVKIFDSVSDIFVRKLKSNFNNTVDVFPLAKLTSLDMICEAAMGSSVGALLDSNSSYVHSVEKMTRIVIGRMFSAIESIDFFYEFTKTAKTEIEALKVIHEYSESVIANRKKELSSTLGEETKEKKKQAFLDLLITYSMQGESLTAEEIQEEVDTFMFEGHDTTASALAFTLYCISKNERVQLKIVEELFNILGDDTNKPTTYEDLQEMKYLELVVKEVLRMYPSVPFHFREIIDDLTFDGKIYPKGSAIMIYNYGAHHDQNYFKDPEIFYPERFETDSNPYRTGGTFSYVPFSAGARNCIGQRFAVLQLKSVVSKVLRHCKLTPCADHKLELVNEAVLVSLSGAHVGILPRNN